MGLGPLDRLLASRSVREVVVDGPSRILADSRRRAVAGVELLLVGAAVQVVLRRLCTRAGTELGGRTGEELELPDGTQVQVLLPPLSPSGPLISIRCPLRTRRPRPMAGHRGRALARHAGPAARRGAAPLNVLVPAPPERGEQPARGAGLDEPDHERIVTLQRSPSLAIEHPHVLALTSRRARAPLGELWPARRGCAPTGWWSTTCRAAMRCRCCSAPQTCAACSPACTRPRRSRRSSSSSCSPRSRSAARLARAAARACIPADRPRRRGHRRRAPRAYDRGDPAAARRARSSRRRCTATTAAGRAPSSQPGTSSARRPGSGGVALMRRRRHRERLRRGAGRAPVVASPRRRAEWGRPRPRAMQPPRLMDARSAIEAVIQRRASRSDRYAFCARADDDVSVALLRGHAACDH